MAHVEQRQFLESVRARFPERFTQTDVLDIGSLDINGNNRWLFTDSEYLGIDIVPGANVDLVTKAHEFHPGRQFPVVISTECLEHDVHWRQTLRHAIALTAPKGLLLITCATENREEHGTTRAHAYTSPGTNDYYANVLGRDFALLTLDPKLWQEYQLSARTIGMQDLYFWGVKA